MKWQHLALLLLVLTAAALPSRGEEDAEDDDLDEEDDFEERAVLLLRRVVADKRPLEGKPTKVTISLYNAGNADAKNIKLVESAWPADNFVVEGELSATFESLPAGSTVQHTYTVVGKQASQYRHAPAVVTYAPGDELAAQTATSATLPFHTHSFGESMGIRALELGSAATGGHFNTVSDWQRLSYVIAASAVAFFGYRSYTSVSASAAKRRRAAALASLGADEKDE